MYRTQSRAHGPCCSSSRICLPVTRAGSGSCVRRGARRRPAVPLLTLPGLDACPLEGAELLVRRRRGADATRPRVGEGRGATDPTVAEREPHRRSAPRLILRGRQGSFRGGYEVAGTQWAQCLPHRRRPARWRLYFIIIAPSTIFFLPFSGISASGTARFQNSTVKATPVASVSWLTGWWL